MEDKKKENGCISTDNIQIKKELEKTLGDILIKKEQSYTKIDELNFLSMKKNIKNEAGEFDQEFNPQQFKKNIKNEAGEFDHEFNPQQFLDVQIAESDQKKNMYGKVFYCPFGCIQSFEMEYLLRIHMQSHREKYRPKCTVCSETFHNELSRDMHMYIHSTSKTFKCLHKDCGKEFHHRTHLFRHVQIYHPTETGIKCSICNANFNSKSLLNDHMQQHGDESRYKCSFCSKSFKEKVHLTNHWVRVHKNNEIGLYSCKMCSAAFTDKEHLNKHVEIHMEKKNQNLVTRSIKLDIVRKVLVDGNKIADNNTNSNINTKNVTNKIESEYERDNVQSVKLKNSSATKLTTLYKCHICNQSFTQKLCLVRHFRVHSKSNTQPVVVDKKCEEKVLEANTEHDILCDVKDLQTNTKQILIQCEKEDSDSFSHSDSQKTTHVVDSVKEDNSSFLSKNIAEDNERNQLETICKREKLANVFRCKLCISIFGTNRGLRKHISQTHYKTLEKEYKYIIKNNKTKKRKFTDDVPLSFNEKLWTLDESSDTTGLVLEYKGPNGWRLTNEMRIDSIISDNYYYSPEGKKFSSLKDIERYCDEKSIKHDLWNFIFSMKF